MAASVAALNTDAPLVANGSFDRNTNGWSAGGATLASVAGGLDGNCLKITNTGAAAGRASQKVSVPNGNYILRFYQKNGTASGYYSIGATEGAYPGDPAGEINSSEWHLSEVELTVTGDFWINFFVWSVSAADYTYIDHVTLTLN